MPYELVGHENLWNKVAKRLKFDPSRGVSQQAPVIGGRRRYHHRPLTTWRLPNRKGDLTITTDPMEAKSWNRIKRRRHIAMPRIKDVFKLELNDGKEYWAILHEPLTYPPDDDWYLFIDTFFRWRAMSKDALKPAQPSDVREFLEWVLDVEGSDKKAHRRRRQDAVVPFDMGQKREKKIQKVKEAIWRDPGLRDKVKWAMKTLKFLKDNHVKHADLDPSNLGKTLKGRTVITNIAESRSQGKNIGRTGRVSGKVSTMKKNKVVGYGQWLRRGRETPEERSARAKKAAQTRKREQIPVEVTINGVKVKGYLNNYGGRVSDTTVQFRSYRTLNKLKDLDMYQVYRYTDDYAYDAADNFGKGVTTTLGSLLKRGNRIYLEKKHDGKWRLGVSPYSNNLWESKPLKVKIRKTEVPEPIDFGSLDAAMSGRDILNAVSACLSTEVNLVSASFDKAKSLSAAIAKRPEARLALFLASNGIKLEDVDHQTAKAAKRGVRSILDTKLGRASGELYNAIARRIA